jgi:hypothetical protein
MTRDPSDSQIDRYLPNRALAYLGGAKSLAGRSSWYTGKLKFLLIADIGYHSIPWLGGLGLSEVEFLALLGLFWLTTVLFEYFVMWPATLIFGNRHGEDANRSPIRQDTQEILRRLDDPEREERQQERVESTLNE